MPERSGHTDTQADKETTKAWGATDMGTSKVRDSEVQVKIHLRVSVMKTEMVDKIGEKNNTYLAKHIGTNEKIYLSIQFERRRMRNKHTNRINKTHKSNDS